MQYELLGMAVVSSNGIIIVMGTPSGERWNWRGSGLWFCVSSLMGDHRLYPNPCLCLHLYIKQSPISEKKERKNRVRKCLNEFSRWLECIYLSVRKEPTDRPINQLLLLFTLVIMYIFMNRVVVMVFIYRGRGSKGYLRKHDYTLSQMAVNKNYMFFVF